MNWKRGIQNVIKWFFNTVIYSLLPLLFYIIICHMFKLQQNTINQYITELCAFTIVIASSTMTELSDKKYKSFMIESIVRPVFLFMFILFLVSYGFIYYNLLLESQIEQEILNGFFSFAKLTSGINFIIAFILQIFGGAYNG